MSYQQTEFCCCHFALCTQSKSVRPSNELFYWHTLSVLFCVRQKKNNAKEHERGRINKGKYNREAWFTLSRMRTLGVPFSLTSPIYLGFFFFAFVFRQVQSQFYWIFVSFSELYISKCFKEIVFYWYNSLLIPRNIMNIMSCVTKLSVYVCVCVFVCLFVMYTYIHHA